MDMIHGRVMASKPKTMQDAIEITTKLMNKKISTLVEFQTENKKRLDNTSKNNQNQQQPNKRQNTGRAYTARHGEKKHYGGSKPLCSKCNYHHDGPCAPKCHQCNRIGHLARDAFDRPPILEKGSYAPWACQFRRFVENKQEEGERMWRSIDIRPYERQRITNPDKPNETILKPIRKITKANKKQFFTYIKVMNYLIQGISNDIYNSVDACKYAKTIWERIKRLMHGFEITKQHRHLRLMNGVDKFIAMEGESLVSVYERLAKLVNVMGWNNVRPSNKSINTKLLNSLQPEWRKYVTLTRQNYNLMDSEYDELG
nr:reverse transcriptase domain-containing protein [Tanacetum cinerariifolium]